MKILVTPNSFLKPINAEAKAAVEAFADEVVYNTTGKPLQPAQLIEMLQGVDGFVAGVDYITEEVINGAPDSLKVISRYGVGTDRVDIPACTRRGIYVTNTPGANAPAVAELAFALMLSVARDLPRLSNGVQNGEWITENGMELKGKTLGVIGMGAIGKTLATRALAFEMNVCAYDPYFDDAFAAQHGIVKKDLVGAVAESDFVSLHLPFSDETRNIIDAKMIGRMKQGAVIINASRGGLIDEDAAAAAVKSGKLGGLGLDAFEQEPLTDSPLFGLPRVILSPHMGGHTNEAIQNMGKMSVQNCIDILEGKDNRFILNKEAKR